MTRLDAIRRQLGDIEKAHERELAKHEMQVNLLCGYRDRLEDHVDIAAGMIAVDRGCSKAAVLDIIACEYETRQSRKVAVGA